MSCEILSNAQFLRHYRFDSKLPVLLCVTVGRLSQEKLLEGCAGYGKVCKVLCSPLLLAWCHRIGRTGCDSPNNKHPLPEIRSASASAAVKIQSDMRKPARADGP